MHKMTDVQREPVYERLLARIPGRSRSVYEDELEDLAEMIAERGGIHPLAYYRKETVTAADGNTITLGGTPLVCPGLAGRAGEGDRVYVCLGTVGKSLDDLFREIDDPMQNYLMGALQSLCLDDAILAFARAAAAEAGLPHIHAVVPGIEENCPLDQIPAVARILAEETADAGVTLSKAGTLNPTYTTTMLLQFSEGDANLLSDWEDEAAAAAFIRELNRMAGHV